MQEIDDVIKIFPEKANYEVLRSAKSIPKRQNSGKGIDQLLMSFDLKT